MYTGSRRRHLAHVLPFHLLPEPTTPKPENLTHQLPGGTSPVHDKPFWNKNTNRSRQSVCGS